MFAKLTRDPGFMLPLLAVGALTVLIRGRRTTPLDRRWSTHRGNGKSRALAVSRAAAPKVGFVEALVVAALPGLRRRERAAILAAPLLAGLMGHGLKRLAPRRRPGWAGWSRNGKESFPSTHTAHAASLAFTAARIARRHGAGAWAEAAAAGIVGLIAVARLRAKAHWPTDVVAGALVGIASERAVRATAPG